MGTCVGLLGSCVSGCAGARERECRGPTSSWIAARTEARVWWKLDVGRGSWDAPLSPATTPIDHFSTSALSRPMSTKHYSYVTPVEELGGDVRGGAAPMLGRVGGEGRVAKALGWGTACSDPSVDHGEMSEHEQSNAYSLSRT
ncbi:hypothetical protein BV22DRAFT_877318 [Leucogyrophana mollusca]|uniref:Uncharacterized protein n=1 Tax=Leucogyrophana mollusca TaxID=85980 RepID=A0ACB8B1Z7_9AGAM|nr:hypothetical protein BV22DRAFT_877318 [Leucogyrophana mollusca]